MARPVVGDIIKINHLPPDVIIHIDDKLLNPIQTARGYSVSYPSKFNKITLMKKLTAEEMREQQELADMGLEDYNKSILKDEE